MRDAPAASAAARRLRVPSRRIREFAVAISGIRAGSSGRSVSSWTTASVPNPTTASRSASASNTSQTTGSAPRARNASFFPGERVIPATSWPLATSSGTSRTPITPLAPARKILIAGKPRHETISPFASRARLYSSASGTPEGGPNSRTGGARGVHARRGAGLSPTGEQCEHWVANAGWRVSTRGFRRSARGRNRPLAVYSSHLGRLSVLLAVLATLDELDPRLHRGRV